ncbi:MAG: hypothetical protein IPN62_13650 [Flavobacteriales bacterium]|nr:hypothetical protein [Flavobacteriales bacterium]
MHLPRILLLTTMVLASLSGWAQSTLAIGQWQDHFPYRQCIAVAQSAQHVYAATANSMFRFDKATGEMDKLSKATVLSDVGIQGLAWNEPLGMLVVYYTNGNLDLIQGNTSTNLGDIKRSSLLGDKTINSVIFDGTTAYLGCGFGIVVLDLARKEVRDTWRIGPNGAQVQVGGIAFHGDSIYAATSTGLFVASRDAANLAAFSNWHQRRDIASSAQDGPFNKVVSFAGRLLLNFKSVQTSRDTLFMLNDQNGWERFAGVFDRANRGMDVSTDGQQLTVTHNENLDVFDTNLVPIAYIDSYVGTVARPQQAIGRFGDLWVADREVGLVRLASPSPASYAPNGPKGANTWSMTSDQGVVLVASGALAGNWSNEFLKEGAHMFKDGRWTTIDARTSPLMLTGRNSYGAEVNDIVAVEVDPEDKEHVWLGSWDDGLIEVRNGIAVEIYNADNSSLGLDVLGFEGRLNVGGMDHDQDGNLWMTNAWSAAPLSVRTKSGSWYSYSPGSLLSNNQLIASILAASNGFKWIVRPRGNALLVFDDNGTLDVTSDDRWKLLNSTEGSGGLPAPDVLTVAEDKEGQIWVGTSKGVAVFYSPENIFSSSGFDAQQILLEQDGNFQYLLETETVSSIVVDGANRKWIGTQTGGVFLVSPDGRTQIQHFTQDNSPLPSNTVYAVTIDEGTGEVFMATDRGIMSYRSDAIEGLAENTCATVFPNPVSESYTGNVAIDGLVRDSEVKITDVSGNLVYRTTSLGGQALWPATDMEGNRVSTGVYLIFAADQFGVTKCNTKVLVVR